MERVIKFRIWDKQENKFFEPTYEAYKGNLSELLIGVNGQVLHRTLAGTSLTDHQDGRWILNQFTGLLDRKKVEIYEGDILAVFDLMGDNDYDEENDSYANERERRVVKWNKNGGFTLEWDYGDFDITLLGWALEHHELQVEVIGNTYENPDLLQ